ncbi:histidine kinase [Candidatus Magnetomoraceae bacterium gMMP-15]
MLMAEVSELTILTIDDEPFVRESIAAYMDDSGFTVIQAENGRMGLEMFRKEKPDVVLVDLRMPEIDGLDVLDVITKESPETPILVVSGTGVLQDAIEALRLGAWDYVTKPIQDMAVLEHAVNKVLERSNLLVENRKYREHLEDEIKKRTALLEERTNTLEITNECLEKEMIERKKAQKKILKLNKELEERVIERTAQLEVANKELESFAYSVSHDLRAPLRSINGFSEVLMEDYSDSLDSNGQDYLQRVCDASRRMEQLIDDILKLSRLTRGEMESVQVELTYIARVIAEELQKNQPKRSVEFIIAPDLTSKGDGRLLRIALENLLGNAWKFTGKIDNATIEFGSTLSEDKEKIFFIRDNGAGFNMKYAEKLFGAFQRLHKADEFQGTGVGLATVQRIIHRHGGRIWAEGAIGKGATFYFTL